MGVNKKEDLKPQDEEKIDQEGVDEVDEEDIKFTKADGIIAIISFFIAPFMAYAAWGESGFLLALFALFMPLLGGFYLLMYNNLRRDFLKGEDVKNMAYFFIILAVFFYVFGISYIYEDFKTAIGVGATWAGLGFLYSYIDFKILAARFNKQKDFTQGGLKQEGGFELNESYEKNFYASFAQAKYDLKAELARQKEELLKEKLKYEENAKETALLNVRLESLEKVESTKELESFVRASFALKRQEKAGEFGF